jgi:hypothetical protein
VADEVAVGGLGLPVADGLLVEAQSLLVQGELVLEGDGEPDVANPTQSLGFTSEAVIAYRYPATSSSSTVMLRWVSLRRLEVS